MSRIVLVDRDGVLNRNLEGYVRSPEDLHVLPNAPRAVARLNEAGFRVVVVTNQAGVGKGLIPPATLELIHAKLQGELAREGGHVHRFYACLHRADEGCRCRKPKPGLIERARAELGFDPGVTWMVGDSRHDVAAARAGGVRPALVRSGIDHTGDDVDGVPSFADLSAFVDFLLDL